MKKTRIYMQRVGDTINYSVGEISGTSKGRLSRVLEDLLCDMTGLSINIIFRNFKKKEVNDAKRLINSYEEFFSNLTYEIL